MCHGAADRIAGVTPTGGGGGGGGFDASALSAMGTSFGAAMKGALPSLEDQEISVADDDRLTTEFDNCYGWPLSEEERPLECTAACATAPTSTRPSITSALPATRWPAALTAATR